MTPGPGKLGTHESASLRPALATQCDTVSVKKKNQPSVVSQACHLSSWEVVDSRLAWAAQRDPVQQTNISVNKLFKAIHGLPDWKGNHRFVPHFSV